MNKVKVTSNRRYFITDLIKFSKSKSYLELGVDLGKNISFIAQNTQLTKCVGVDIRKVASDKFTFYEGSTDEFFVNNTDNFDLIFIDACHEFAFVKRDFVNSLKYLNKNGIILLHDVDPISVNFIQEKYSGDAYKIVDWIYEKYPNLNVIILPIDETGIAIVNRKSDRRIYNYKG